MADIKIKQGVGKTITFTYTNSAGVAVSLAGASLTFIVRTKQSSTSKVMKIDSGTSSASWTRTQQTSGIIQLLLSSSDTSIAVGNYYGEIKALWTTTNTDKSRDLSVLVERAINH